MARISEIPTDELAVYRQRAAEWIVAMQIACHKKYIDGKNFSVEYVQAKELKVGDRVKLSQGWATIKAIADLGTRIQIIRADGKVNFLLPSDQITRKIKAQANG